jgi:hypothetical protein
MRFFNARSKSFLFYNYAALHPDKPLLHALRSAGEIALCVHLPFKIG